MKLSQSSGRIYIWVKRNPFPNLYAKLPLNFGAICWLHMHRVVRAAYDGTGRIQWYGPHRVVRAAPGAKEPQKLLGSFIHLRVTTPCSTSLLTSHITFPNPHRGELSSCHLRDCLRNYLYKNYIQTSLTQTVDMVQIVQAKYVDAIVVEQDQHLVEMMLV